MRRVAIALTAVALAAVPFAAAHGATISPTITTVTWHPGANPTGTGWWSDTCSTSGAVAMGPHTSSNSDTLKLAPMMTPLTSGPDLGSVSWEAATDKVVGAEFGPAVTVSNPQSITTASIDVRSMTSSPIQGRAAIYYQVPHDTIGDYWFAESTVDDTSKTVGSWHTLSFGNTPFVWRRYHSDGTSDKDVTPATIASFTGHNGNGPMDLGFQFGCNSSAFAFDNLTVGNSVSVTRYDLATVATRLTNWHSTGTITAGGRMALEGDLSSRLSGHPVTGKLTLEALGYGGRSWVASSSATGSSVASTAWPSRRTSYRYHFAGSGAYAASTSPALVTNVRIAVGASAPKSLIVGKTIKVHGSTKPGKAHLKVKLQRRVGSSWRTLRTVRTTGSGGYSFAVKAAHTGKWRLRVSVPAASGNLANTSATRVVTVKPKPSKHHTGGGGGTGTGTGTGSGTGSGTGTGTGTCHKVVC